MKISACTLCLAFIAKRLFYNPQYGNVFYHYTVFSIVFSKVNISNLKIYLWPVAWKSLDTNDCTQLHTSSNDWLAVRYNATIWQRRSNHHHVTSILSWWNLLFNVKVFKAYLHPIIAWGTYLRFYVSFAEMELVFVCKTRVRLKERRKK